jgi:alpha-glucosidase (family GH31 glycosyl hydrolase)
MEEYKFANDPLPNPKSVISGPQYRFTVLNEHVLRYEWAEDGQFEDRPSTFALFRKFPTPTFRVQDTDDTLIIITPLIRLTYDKKRFSPGGLFVEFSSKLKDWGASWRFGDNLEGSNLGGTARTLDGVDGRCDMGTGVLSRDGFSTIDDSTSMLFDELGFVTPRRTGDRIDGYLFSFGNDYKGAMRSFYAISGPQPSVPRWSLGNWWSRYHAYTQDEYINLMKKFKDNDVPLSVAVIDMDWHWVKEDFVSHAGWTGYSWNTDLFPKPEEFAKALHDMDLKITLNDHPHAGIASHEEIYEEVSKVLGHDTSNKDPVPFDPTSPTFMHAFFNVVHRSLEKKGCDFWWVDWQQGSNTRIPGLDPLWLLNHFQFLDTKKAIPSSLPLVFSRYAGPGSHRYPVGFSGDSFATWDSLKFQPEFTATASNIGYGWWSHDIGGHLPGFRDDECTARWVQYGAFSPILRLHSANTRWMSKEPWLYRDESMSAMKDIMRFRHRLVPYIYSISAADSSLPFVQPLYWSHPDADVAYQFPNQYYFGPSMVVAPVVSPRDPRTNLAEVKAWVPPGRHVDIFTGIVYDGNRKLNLYRGLNDVPVLLPAGSIVPLDAALVPSNGCKNPTEIELLVVVGQDGHFELLEDRVDDAAGAAAHSTHYSTKFIWNQSKGQLSCEGRAMNWTFRFIAARTNTIKVFIDGELTTTRSDLLETEGNPASVIVRVPASSNRATIKTVIALDPDTQLQRIDHMATLSDLLRDYQVHVHQKEAIWKILESSQGTTVKVGELLNLGLDKAIIGPIMERLLADSRKSDTVSE